MEKNARLERLIELSYELYAAGDARPYDPDKYNRIVDELNTLMNPRPAKPKSKWIVRTINWLSARKFSFSSFSGRGRPGTAPPADFFSRKGKIMKSKHFLTVAASVLERRRPVTIGTYNLHVVDRKIALEHGERAPDSPEQIIVLTNVDINEGLTSNQWDHINSRMHKLRKEGKI